MKNKKQNKILEELKEERQKRVKVEIELNTEKKINKMYSMVNSHLSYVVQSLEKEKNDLKLKIINQKSSINNECFTIKQVCKDLEYFKNHLNELDSVDYLIEFLEKFLENVGKIYE